MALDPRVLLGGVPVNIDPGLSPFEMEAGRQQLMSGRNKLMAYQSGVNKQNALSSLIKGATNDQGVTDYNKLSSEANKQGFGQEGIAAHNQARAIAGEADIDQGAEIDKAIKTIEFLGRMSAGVRDDASLQELRAQAEELAPGSSAKLPVTYTPEGMNKVLQQAMTHKEKLEQQKVEYQKSQDLQKQQNDDRTSLETSRHNLATENNSGEPTLITDPTTGQPKYVNRKDAYGQAPGVRPKQALSFTPAIRKQRQDSADAVQTTSSLDADIGTIVNQIDTGTLNLGPLDNLWNAGRNSIDSSTEESRNYSTLNSSLKKIVNESLRLNKGVQTEGDAIRAAEEITSGTNDSRLIKKRLQELQGYNKRARDYHQSNIESIDLDYDRDGTQPPVVKSVIQSGGLDTEKHPQGWDQEMEDEYTKMYGRQ